jgi:O-antigen/teichoic acid export membrane protein
MLRQAGGTIAARIITTAMALLVSVVAGHRLGVEGLGTIGLVMLGVSLLALGAGALGGGVLVYLVPRVPLPRLLLPAYAWAAACSMAGWGLLHGLPLVPAGYEVHVAGLAFLQAGWSIQTGALMGRERIAAYNLVDGLRAVLLLGFFFALSMRPDPTPMDYVHAAWAAYALGLLASILALGRSKAPALPAPGSALRLMLQQGLLVAGANGLQLLLYRLGYWLIERFRGIQVLGLYVVANQLAEGAWMVPRSLAVVLYSKVSNTSGQAEQRRITLDILKLCMASATGALLLLLAVPETWFSVVFGPEVSGIRPLVALLAPGILALAASQAFSHFFSGTARNKHNVIASGLGLAAMAVCGFSLVPQLGLVGAAFSASVAYLLAAGYQTWVFMRITGTAFRGFWPRREDLRRIRGLLRTKR